MANNYFQAVIAILGATLLTGSAYADKDDGALRFIEEGHMPVYAANYRSVKYWEDLCTSNKATFDKAVDLCKKGPKGQWATQACNDVIIPISGNRVQPCKFQ